MSSEAITRNDLTAILNEVLPPTPSEYKKLLWTNSNPATEFAAQTITIDLTDYDEVEVWFNCWRNRADTSLQFRVKKGTYGIATQGASTNTSSGINPFVVGSYIIMQDRPIYVTNTGVQFGTCTEGASNGTMYNANGSMIPVYIYGIKYERVAPPQIEAELEEFTLTLNTGISGATGVSRCTYNSVTGIVKLSASIYSANYWDQNTTMFTIPEKYRPTTSFRAPAFVMTNAPISAGFHVDINADGTIKQGVTSACRSVYFVVEYKIATQL